MPFEYSGRKEEARHAQLQKLGRAGICLENSLGLLTENKIIQINHFKSF